MYLCAAALHREVNQKDTAAHLRSPDPKGISFQHSATALSAQGRRALAALGVLFMVLLTYIVARTHFGSSQVLKSSEIVVLSFLVGKWFKMLERKHCNIRV